MVKLAVFFFVAVAFQAVFAGLTFGEENLVKYLDEVQEFTAYLHKDLAEKHFPIQTITVPFQRYTVMVEEIMKKNHAISMVKHYDEKTVKSLMHMLEQIHTDVQKISLYTEMSDVKQFFVDMETLLHNFHKLITFTYNNVPKFEFTLKYLIADLMSVLFEIHTRVMYTQPMDLTPEQMMMKMREYTKETTDVLKKFMYPIQMPVALRGYIIYVNEIIHELESKKNLGVKEFDFVMHNLAEVLRKTVTPLVEMNEQVDIKTFRSEITTRFFEIFDIFTQLKKTLETEHMPHEVQTFVEKIFLHYFYTLEMIHKQMMFEEKINFFAPEYYIKDHYYTYGFGLYETIFEKLYFTPSIYNTETYSLFPQYYMDKHFDEYKRVPEKMNYKFYETSKKMNMHEIPETYKKMHYDFYEMPEKMNFYPKSFKFFETPKKMEYIPEKMDLYSKNFRFYESPKKINTYTTDFYHRGTETPREMLTRIEDLLKTVFVKFETMDMHMFQYYVREFVQMLDIVNEKLVRYEHVKEVQEIHMDLKKMKMFFEKMTFTSFEEDRKHFMYAIEMFTVEMYKLFNIENFDRVLLKDLLEGFLNFFHKFNKMSYFHVEKDLLTQIRTFTSKMGQIKYVAPMTTVTYMRQFINVLEYTISMMDKHMNVQHEDKVLHEVFVTLKQMKMELEHLTGFTLLPATYNTHFFEYIKIFTTEMEKMMTVEEFPILKEVYTRYVHFLQKFFFEINKEVVEYPKNTLYETKTVIPFFILRTMRY
ncbi:hypothetical protein FQA39_LY18113 [Lamprigera yunnana]|nr:hypothetical protein FQA39_LY18113 [Lamprigera yunnana]